MTTKRTYVPPRVLNLSSGRVEGQQEGFCENGTHPVITQCRDGYGPDQLTDVCSPTGNRPLLGECGYGDNAASNCQSGSFFAAKRDDCIDGGRAISCALGTRV